MKVILLIVLLSVSVSEALWNRGGPKTDDKKCEDTLCPANFIGYNGHCYHFSDDSERFAPAKAVCENYGAYLVRIDSQEENIWLYNQIKALEDDNNFEYYTGAHFLNGVDWRWVDNGEVLTYTDWTTAPTGSETATKALILVSEDGNGGPVEWKMSEVSISFHYICEAESDALFEFMKRED